MTCATGSDGWTVGNDPLRLTDALAHCIDQARQARGPPPESLVFQRTLGDPPEAAKPSREAGRSNQLMQGRTYDHDRFSLPTLPTASGRIRNFEANADPKTSINSVV